MKKRQWMGDIIVFWVAHAMSYGGQTCPFIVSLEVPPCSLFYEVARGSELWVVCWQTIIFFLPSFLSVLFSLDFSIVVPMFFIVYFHPWSFYKKNLCFQFSLLFFPIRSLFFWFLIFFLGSLLKFCWFSILSFNQSLCCFIVFNLALILLISFFFC
jgi:hypothetical protein